MNKKLIIALSVVVLILAGCGQKAAAPGDNVPSAPDAGETAVATGNEEVDNVGENIDDVSQVDTELDDSGLEGLEDTLSDIENI